MADAKKIAAKLINQGEKFATKGGAEDAVQILERLLPTGATDAERAALRSDPEKYKQYLNALDAQYGNRAQRSKDLGFSDETYFHGTAHDFEKFRPDVKTYVSPDAWVASDYAEQSATDHAKWGPDGVLPESEYYRTKNGLGQRVLPLKVKNQVVSPNESILREATVANPADIRSTNAAFDPRFKDSADILALTGNAAPKIVGRMLKPKMNLGDAFEAINEPMNKIDELSGRNEVTKSLGDKITDIAARIPGYFERTFNPMYSTLTPEQKHQQNQELDPAKQADVVRPYVQGAVDMMVPSAAGELTAGISPLMRAANGRTIAQKVLSKEAANVATKEAVQAADKMAEQKLSEFASKDTDWTNLSHKPSSAELLQGAIDSGFGKTAVKDTAPSKFGTVTVKP